MTGGATAFDRIEALVIGASAGGVDALLTLLPALPTRCKVPVMIVLPTLAARKKPVIIQKRMGASSLRISPAVSVPNERSR